MIVDFDTCLGWPECQPLDQFTSQSYGQRITGCIYHCYLLFKTENSPIFKYSLLFTVAWIFLWYGTRQNFMKSNFYDSRTSLQGPEVSIETPSLDFGLVRLGQTVRKQFYLTNESQVLARWNLKESEEFLSRINNLDRYRIMLLSVCSINSLKIVYCYYVYISLQSFI